MNRMELNGRRVNVFASATDLLDYIADKRKILVGINAEKIINRTPEIIDIINSNIGYIDGAGAVMAARRKGASEACKIPGCELWLKLIERFCNTRSFYLIGGTAPVVEETARRLRVDFPGIAIAGYHDGYLTHESSKSEVIDDIVRTKPDVVFVAMGSPRQELFMAELHKLHPAVYMGLGGSFDIYTGRVKRAPKWWVDHNMEFAYRLISQPKRLKRQIHLWRFAWMLLTNRL